MLKLLFPMIAFTMILILIIILESHAIAKHYYEGLPLPTG